MRRHTQTLAYNSILAAPHRDTMKMSAEQRARESKVSNQIMWKCNGSASSGCRTRIWAAKCELPKMANNAAACAAKSSPNTNGMPNHIVVIVPNKTGDVKCQIDGEKSFRFPMYGATDSNRISVATIDLADWIPAYAVSSRNCLYRSTFCSLHIRYSVAYGSLTWRRHCAGGIEQTAMHCGRSSWRAS